MSNIAVVEGWHSSQLSDLAWIKKGALVPTNDSGRGVPYLGAESLAGGPPRTFTESTGGVMVEPTDVVMLWDGERSGLCGTGLFGTAGSTLARLRVKSPIESRFLYRALDQNFGHIQAHRTGTGVPHVPKDLSTYLEILLPDDPCEQRRIAEVLDTVDEAIRSIDCLVAKLEQMKLGMLDDLVNLPIARNQDGVPLGEALLTIEAGWTPASQDVAPRTGEWGVLKVSAVSGGAYDPAEAKRLAKGVVPRAELEVKVGDVLLARANGVADLVATVALVSTTPPGLTISDKTLRLVPRKEMISGAFMTLTLQSASSRRQIRRMLNGSSGQQNISQAQIRRILIALPSLTEQAEIVDAIGALDSRLDFERGCLFALRGVKSGLMKDLLTGCVRVSVNQDAA